MLCHFYGFTETRCWYIYQSHILRIHYCRQMMTLVSHLKHTLYSTHSYQPAPRHRENSSSFKTVQNVPFKQELGKYLSSSGKHGIQHVQYICILLVIWVTFHNFDAICGVITGSFKFRWSRGYIDDFPYNHHQIGCINLSHCCHNFSGWGGVEDFRG